MICFIALVVFAVLGIFSASHRKIALEAFNCVFRRVTFRKCTTAFDKKVKMKIVGKLMKRSERTSKFVLKHFEFLSWILTIAMIVSFIFMVMGFYNLFTFGTCDPANPENCPFGTGETYINPTTGEAFCECNFSMEGCSVEDFEFCGTDCDCLSEKCMGENLQD